MVIYETNCHWADCTKEYDTQEQLVHVSSVPSSHPGMQSPNHNGPRAFQGLCFKGVEGGPPPLENGRYGDQVPWRPFTLPQTHM